MISALPEFYMNNSKPEQKITVSFSLKEFEALLKAIVATGAMYGPLSDFVDERYKKDVEVHNRLERAACAAAAATGVGAEALLAEHLACGRFIDFHVAEAAHGAAA